MSHLPHHSLWRWICIRILVLGIGTVLFIALCMWLRFAIQGCWTLHHMPAEVQREFSVLRENPESNPARFHQIIDQFWGIKFSDPSIASADWMTVGVMVIVMIPIIVIAGLRLARPLALQFSHLAAAADAVARGEFGTTAQPVKNAPAELVCFTEDFNAMTVQLARYDRELRASHVAMAHELRSPLTAAMGRLQGMMDNVFLPDPQQLAMVMKQLQQLNRLTEQLHLLSLADAGHLELSKSVVNLTEILLERAAWLKPLQEMAGMRTLIESDQPCHFVGDPLRIGQVFTILMENAMRYASEGQYLHIRVRQYDGYREVYFHDRGPGVSPEFLPDMFERFSREETSRARHFGGSGLGLSIARAICIAHGGSISATLPEEGGLLITLHLPDQ